MTRERLPDRRPMETFRLDHTWLKGTDRAMTETMTVTVGRYGVDDRRIGEVFVNCDNHLNERAIALWHDIGILISFALQRLEELRGKNLACWCRLDGKPCHADALLLVANQ